MIRSFLQDLFHAITYPIRVLFSAPQTLLAGPRRLLSISLPLRVAIFVEILLILVTIGAYIVFLTDAYRPEYEVWLTFSRISLIVLLLIIIPIVIYNAVKLWMEGETSEFPDIDEAWRAGMEALAEHGLDITNIPVFLVIGVQDEGQAKALFRATHYELSVRDVPAGKAALHWYANTEGVFLVCTSASCIGRLVARAAAAGSSTAAAHVHSEPSTGEVPSAISGTIVAGLPVGDESAATPPPQSGSITGSAIPNGHDVAPARAGGGGEDIYKTIRADLGIALASEPGRRPHVGAPPHVTLSQRETEEQRARLDYVCRLLHQARQPLCPANGILALLPFSAVYFHSGELRNAALHDLSEMRRALKLRCPAVALVSGMETENGFRELVRRLGATAAQEYRFGKGSHPLIPAIPIHVDAVVRIACGAFEEFAYELFSRKDGLSKPGNAKLFSLLCKTRTYVCDGLSQIVVDGFSRPPQDAGSGEAMLFAGCYFAATGERTDRQAFVHKVLDKMITEEGILDWGDEALAEDNRYHRLANGVLLFNGALAMAVIGMLVWHWWT